MRALPSVYFLNHKSGNTKRPIKSHEPVFYEPVEQKLTAQWNRLSLCSGRTIRRNTRSDKRRDEHIQGGVNSSSIIGLARSTCFGQPEPLGCPFFRRPCVIGSHFARFRSEAFDPRRVTTLFTCELSHPLWVGPWLRLFRELNYLRTMTRSRDGHRRFAGRTSRGELWER